MAIDSSEIQQDEFVRGSEFITEKSDLSYQDAAEGTLIEHRLTTMEAVRIHWKGIIWCLIFGLSIVMRAFDIEIFGNFYALPAFQTQFGFPVKGHGNQIPASWQTAIGNGNGVGQIIGAYLVTYPMERYGRIRTMIAFLVCSSILVFMQFFATSLAVLCASEYLCGVIWGGYPVLVQTYCSEMLPVVLRGYLTGYINLCYVMGQFICTGVASGFANNVTQWAWRIPFALQWLWPCFLVPALLFAPESAWWLMRKDRVEEAKKALKKTCIEHPKINIDKTLAMMLKTDLVEQQIEKGTSYFECFKGPNRRRTEICLMLCVINNFTGNPVGYASYFFEQVGLSTQNSFYMGVGVNGVGFVGTVLSVFLIRYFGHRTIFLFGILASIAILLTVAFMCLAPNYHSDPTIGWAQASMLILLQFISDPTLNTYSYILICETPATRLRSKTVSLTAVLGALTSIALSAIGPYFLNPGAINAGGKIEFLYGGVLCFAFLYCYLRLPELKGRTYEEIDVMFARNVPTRQFARYKFGDATDPTVPTEREEAI